MDRAGHRTLPHTADLIIEAWGPTQAACLSEAVRGLVGSFADTSGAPALTPWPFHIDPAGDDELLVALLEEVLYLLDARGAVPVDVAIEPTASGGLAGCFHVAPVEGIEVIGPAPKAVTRHRLWVGRRDGLWACRATIDV